MTSEELSAAIAEIEARIAVDRPSGLTISTEVVEEMLALVHDAETVCTSYADENQRLSDRAVAAEKALAELRAAGGTSRQRRRIRRMAFRDDGKAMLALERKYMGERARATAAEARVAELTKAIETQAAARTRPYAWVIPGDDTARDGGWLDARIDEWGEFTKPLYASPLSLPQEVAEAVAAERERCAEIAARMAAAYVSATGIYDKACRNTALGLAAAIRARTPTQDPAHD